MRYALLSVFDKTGIEEFARGLVAQDFAIIGSVGTAKVLNGAGIPTMTTQEFIAQAVRRRLETLMNKDGLRLLTDTQIDLIVANEGKDILDHRVVTLQPEVHGPLLAKHIESHKLELDKLGVPYIDLVCVDLYPLEAAIKAGKSREEVIEMTDVGGPTMLRSAAKGRRIVICDPADRPGILDWIRQGEPERERCLQQLAAKAEFICAKYCLASAEYHGQGEYAGLIGLQRLKCKYGENAWQTPAALYSTNTEDPLALDRFEVVAGQAASFNNWADIDRMLQTITHIAAGLEMNFKYRAFMGVAVKHGNACGAAFGDTPEEVVKKVVTGNTRAIFGGLAMFSFHITEELAELILTHNSPDQRRLLDGIVASSFAPEAVELLRRKGDKCRFLANPALAALGGHSLDTTPRFRYTRGSFLRQPNYTFVLDLALPTLSITTADDDTRLPRDLEKQLVLAWAVGCTSNSNTVALVRDNMLIGLGTGQQDRVGAAELALKRAHDGGHISGVPGFHAGVANISYYIHDPGTVAYSDSFFPFEDGPKILAEAKVTAILTSSGSIRDQHVVELCRRHRVSLYMVPDAEGRGFFGH